jgi:hypothetical protein
MLAQQMLVSNAAPLRKQNQWSRVRLKKEDEDRVTSQA